MTEITFLSGGTGTPKLLDGARDIVPEDEITVVCNTADDAVVGGNLVCPDVDSVLYTLSDAIDREHWWGVAGDGTVTHDRVRSLLGFGAAGGGDPAPDEGGDGAAAALAPRAVEAHRRIGEHRTLVGAEAYMTIGDRDRATHVARTELIAAGRTLTAATRHLADAMDVAATVLPMSDDAVATWISTPDGALHFQEWLIRHGAEPAVEDVAFRGADGGDAGDDDGSAAEDGAAATDAVLDTIRDGPVVIGPSNPVTSIGPMLALPGVEEALAATRVVAVSPFVGGNVVSGPAATLMAATGHEAGHRGVAARYEEFLDVLVVDEASGGVAGDVDCGVVAADTVMADRSDAAALCEHVLDAVDG